MKSPFKDRKGDQLNWQQAKAKIINRFYNYWLDLKIALLWRFVSYIPFHSIRVLLFRLSGVKIGAKSTLHIGARFFDPSNITIGDGSIVGDHSLLDGRASLTIGNHVDIASEVMIYNSKHNINDPDFNPISSPVSIGDYCFIGPRAIIMPGVKIGTGAVVAAGAVVTKNVDSMDIVAGVPAKTIGSRKVNKLSYKLGRFRLFQ